MTSIDREGDMGVTHATRPPRHPLCSIRRVRPPARSDAQIIWLGVKPRRCRRTLPAAPNGYRISSSEQFRLQKVTGIGMALWRAENRLRDSWRSAADRPFVV